jgi:hypothetical protein
VDPLKGVLEEVFGLVSIAGHAHKVPQHAVAIPTNDLAKRRRITLNVGGDQILIRVFQSSGSNYPSDAYPSPPVDRERRK